ncbi:hypothetical protein [Nocardioides jejuensis]|uniref:Uncharacterized protein n=1 Tax=Nocardioides jejuensis TaxID=2502782 RepID=A0A4R1BUK4_9ACTN|nr:hypothetical protein [Nocardioides jejuensis]TCJ21584.1 hypothetical protein EPD65_14705 [Nocardioides jejuensis]
MIAALLVMLVGTSIGWARSSDQFHLVEDKPARFESCTFDGRTLTLGFFYGVNERVAPSVDTRHADKIVVALEDEVGRGAAPAIGLTGRATFRIFSADPDSVFEYADGEPLRCERPTQDPKP